MPRGCRERYRCDDAPQVPVPFVQLVRHTVGVSGQKFSNRIIVRVLRLQVFLCGGLAVVGGLYFLYSSTFEIISGYRSPKTNEMLRKCGIGVARNSLHIQGGAINFSLRNVGARKVRDVARALTAGGVGYFASSDFVHSHTGRINHWG